MNVKTISRNVGYALLVSALFMFLSILVSIGSGNDSALAALIISFTITFTVGIFPFIFVKKGQSISLKDGYVIVVLSWLLSFIFGMLPYVLWGGPFTIENAWFESVSGFTTSGATILDDIESLPNSLLFWRSSTHFIGGLGVVVFLLLIIPQASPIRMRLTSMELSSVSKEGYSSRANKTVFIFAYVYLALFVVAFFSYWAAGMSAFDAVNHAFSVCSTGGFSTKADSIAGFHSRLVEGLTMIFMFTSSIHFGSIFMMFARRSIKPVWNPVVKFYISYVLFFSLIMAFSFFKRGEITSFGDSLWTGLFTTLCFTTTTGFAIVDNANWPLLLQMVMLLSGFICACAGSTSGGVKVDRVLVLLKSIRRQTLSILHPNSVREIRLGDHALRDDEVRPMLFYLNLYVVMLVVSIFFSLLLGTDTAVGVTGSIASLGNLGPATGECGTMGSFNCLPIATKFIFSMDMFLGRVEIYPVLAVIAMMFDHKDRVRHG